jgi:hypothetical protein
MSNFLETYITKFKTWANGKFCTEAEMQAYVDYYLLTYSKQPIIDAFVNSLSSETQSAIEDYLATVIVVSISATGVANRGSVCSDANVVLTATAENVPEGVTPTYAWQKYNGAGYEAVNGANGNTLTPALTAGTHTYRAVVTVNNTNYTTDNFTLTVYQPYTADNVSVAIFAISPSNVNLAEVIEGTDVTFRAVPNPATLTYTYQWYLNGAAVTGATNATYTYTAPAAGTLGYVKCVATLDATGIYKDPNWNGEKTSNIAAVTAIADPNALGTISNFGLDSKQKISAKLTWTKTKANDTIVIIIKQVLNGTSPAGVESNTFIEFADTEISAGTIPTISIDNAPSTIDDYKVVYKNTIGIERTTGYPVSSTNGYMTITGLTKSTNYTVFAFLFNADTNRYTAVGSRVIFKTNSY